ncbi:hypothetical protein MP638_006846 [Amoeboaphelidium occidentale]|nr:hypothetical protein MP638_006846 [Amoeboaphelidium occidentale]
MIRLPQSIALLTWICALAILGLTPNADLPDFGVSDKFLHFVAFIVSSILAHYVPDIVLSRRIRIMYFCFWLLLAYLSEIFQSLLPYRDMDVYDVLFNVFGVTAGCFLVSLYEECLKERLLQYSSVSEQSGLELQSMA